MELRDTYFTLAAEGKTKKALKALEALEADTAMRLNARALRASIHFNVMHDAETGMALIQQNLQENPNHFWSYFYRGLFYRRLLENDRAAADFQLASRLPNAVDSLKASALLQLSYIQERQTMFEAALSTCEHGLTLDSSLLELEAQKASLLNKLGQPELAIHIMEKLEGRIFDSVGLLNNLCFLYLGAERYADAVDIYNRILAFEPDAAFCWSNRAYAKLQLGQHDAALEDIQHSIKLMPSNSWAHRNLGIIRQAMDQPDAACAAWRDARAWGFERMYGPEVDQLIREHCR